MVRRDAVCEPQRRDRNAVAEGEGENAVGVVVKEVKDVRGRLL
jgi:hypothetical protein